MIRMVRSEEVHCFDILGKYRKRDRTARLSMTEIFIVCSAILLPQY